MTALLAILAALAALTMWCCCVAAGRADKRMEALERSRQGEEADDHAE